jgi:hypothetical protein
VVSRGSRRALAIAALLAAGLLAWLTIRRDPRDQRIAAAASAPVAAPQSGARPVRSAAPAAGEGPRASVVIDAVEIEKTRLCAGEENLVTVRAHTVDAADAPELKVYVDGQSGTRVVLRPDAYLKPDGSPPRVTAVIDDGRQASVDIPRFEVVSDCRPERTLVVRDRMLPNLEDTRELWAQVVERPREGRSPAAAFRPVRYHWQFGEGAAAESESPIITRSFRDRPQTSLVSDVLVTCTAQAADGSKLVARHSMQFLNAAYEQLARKGSIHLEVDHKQFPEADERGVVVWPVRVWHHYDTPVTITDIRVTRVDRSSMPLRDERAKVESVLGAARIAPRGGIDATVRLDTRAEPEVAYVMYQLIGRADDGTPASGGFSVMRPTEPPTREKHTPVNDPQLMAKIVTAQKLLGRPFVTDEDLWRLEREGRLSDAVLETAELPQRWREPTASNSPRAAARR